MAIPYTNTQTPDNSILDINGKQTYLGNSFTLAMPGAALSDTSETPICVVKNPTSSGRSLFLFNRKLSSDNNSALIRFYLNPVLNVPGATTTPVNLRPASTNTSMALCYLAATISSNGSLISVLAANQFGLSSDLLIILDPGKSILVTAQQADSGTSNIFTENAWYEI